jgi:recombination protein U
MAIRFEDLPMKYQEQIAKQQLREYRKKQSRSGEGSAKRRAQAARSNAEGHHFEDEITKACEYYRATERASVEKTPESFRVTHLLGEGKFQGRFTGKAQPDFQGVLMGGRAILFDAKYTEKDRITENALTKHQRDLLELHWRLGAKCGVCVGMKDGAYFVPWETWRNMKDIYGRKYMTEENLQEFRVKFSVHSFVMFLDYEEIDRILDHWAMKGVTRNENGEGRQTRKASEED